MARQIDIDLPRLHAGQIEIVKHPARFKVVANGRRWGKTRLGMYICLTVALTGGRAWWVAPSYPMSTVGWRGLKGLARQIPGAELREVDRIITFAGGGTVQVRSADNPDSLRGEGLDYVVLDECAYMQEDAWTNALRPALSDRKGGALFISTPRGRNWFHRLYQRGLGDTDLNWAAWSYPTVDNPYIDPVEIERARQELPSDIFAQEYLAEFVDDGGLVFRNVTACLWEPPSEPERGRRYMAGVDWAQSRDWTVIVVMDDLGRVVAIERSNQIAWDVQRARLAGIVDRWGVVHVLAEANAIGGPNIEQLQVEGLPVVGFMTTNESKSRVIQALVLAFERGGIAIPEHAVLLAELMAFEAGRLPSGRWQYAAPAGMHDDTVIALALAWWAHHNMPEVAFADSPFY